MQDCPVAIHTRDYLDWNEIEAYINKKYNCDLRDYAGRFCGPSPNKDTPFQDFWHWLLSHTFSEISNGSFSSVNWKEELDRAILDNEQAWVIEILKLLVAEFGEKDWDICTEW